LFLKQSILPLEKPSVISSKRRRYFKIIFVKKNLSNLENKQDKTEINEKISDQFKVI
jgi:hypothetical protein